MTWNLYVGTEFAPLLEPESLSEMPAAVAGAWARVLASDFPERAGALAAEIEGVRPHLVGVQEAALFRIQSPGDFFLGNLLPARDTVLDFLALLVDSLDRRGLTYVPVASARSFDEEAPMEGRNGLLDLRLTDRDVVLARSDVGADNPRGGRYGRRMVVEAGPVELVIPKAWVSVDARVDGRAPFRFLSTHLEITDFGTEVQEDQASELLGMLGETLLPTVVVGDFNADGHGGSPTYDRLLEWGLRDAWPAAGSGGAGLTCCHEGTLRGPGGSLRTRIDLVLGRGAVEFRSVTRLGADPDRRTVSGLWPSDHAGVAAEVEIR